MDNYTSETSTWTLKAACYGCKTDLWFPERGEDPRPARRICAGCVVRQECLDYAIRNDIKFGIWGGLGERERRQVRRRCVPIQIRETA